MRLSLPALPHAATTSPRLPCLDLATPPLRLHPSVQERAVKWAQEQAEGSCTRSPGIGPGSTERVRCREKAMMHEALQQDRARCIMLRDEEDEGDEGDEGDQRVQGLLARPQSPPYSPPETPASNAGLRKGGSSAEFATQ